MVNVAREVLEFRVNCIVAYSKANKRLECVVNALVELSFDDSLSPSKSKACIRNPTALIMWWRLWISSLAIYDIARRVDAVAKGE